MINILNVVSEENESCDSENVECLQIDKNVLFRWCCRIDTHYLMIQHQKSSSTHFSAAGISVANKWQHIKELSQQNANRIFLTPFIWVGSRDGISKKQALVKIKNLKEPLVKRVFNLKPSEAHKFFSFLFDCAKPSVSFIMPPLTLRFLFFYGIFPVKPPFFGRFSFSFKTVSGLLV